MGRLGGAGTQTSSLAFGGEPPGYYTGSFEYNGTSWTAGGNLPTSRDRIGSAGTQTTALVFGGQPILSTTNEYDGTSWTAGGNLGTGRQELAGCGTQTSAAAFAGSAPAISTATEEFTGGPVVVTRTVTGT
jgi:hypothetical protein